MTVRVRIKRATAANAARVMATRDIAPLARQALADAKATAPRETGTLERSLDLHGPRIVGTEVHIEIGVFHSGQHVTRFSGEHAESRPTVAQVLYWIENGSAATGKKGRWRFYHSSSAKYWTFDGRKYIPPNNFLIKATNKIMRRYNGKVRDYTRS